MYKDDLREFMMDEILDILDQFPTEQLADEIISIGQRLMVRDFCNGHLKIGKFDYLYSINNKMKGWVSISSDDCTGVSRTEYKPFWKDEEDGWFTGLCSLASMINEAWYHCNN